MWEPANLTGLTILGQPAFLSVVPWVRPFLFIGKFFRQYPSLLLTQTTLTPSCGCSRPAKSPCTGCYSSCSYLYYLCSYTLLSKLCCYWFPHHCWVWFPAPFDRMLLFCSSYCLLLPTILCGMSFQKTPLKILKQRVLSLQIYSADLENIIPLISTWPLRGWRKRLLCWHMHYHPRFTLMRCWDEWGELPLSTLLLQALCMELDE